MDKKTLTRRLVKRSCVKELTLNQAAAFFDRIILLLGDSQKTKHLSAVEKERRRRTLLDDIINIDLKVLRRIENRRLKRIWYAIDLHKRFY